MEQNQLYLIKSGQNSFVETEGEVVIGFSGGNIGFGTTNPETFMHVTGNAQIDGDLTVKGDFTTVNSSTIQVDDKNIEIGVGANTDAAADGGGITLHGATQKTINWADTTDAWTSSEHLHTADGKHIASDQIRALDGEGLKIYDDGGNGMFVQDGGNVGVGTTNPGATFDVVGSGNFSASISAGTSVDATTTMSAGTSLTTPTVKAADANGLNLQDDDGNGIVIADGGNVTIQEDLSIGGNLTVAGNKTTLNTQTLEIEDHNIVIASNTGYNQLTDVYPVGGDYAGVFWGTGDAGAASPVSLTYQSNKGFAFEGGNVGIGTANPSAKLHVDLGGTGTIAEFRGADTDLLHIDGDSNQITLDARNVGALAFEMQGSEAMRINSSSNVGIGTTNPLTKMYVGTSAGVYSSAQGINEGLTIDDPNQCSLNLYHGGAGSALSRIVGIKTASGNTDLAFITQNTVLNSQAGRQEWMRITNTGNVGIGTTSPSAKLHVDSGEAELTFGNNASGGNANLRIWRNDSSIAIDNPLGYLSFAGSDAATSPTDHAAISAIAEESHEYTSDPLSEKNGTQLTFFTTNLGQSTMSRKMTISANGNVGIGTTNPGAKLDIFGSNSSLKFTRDAGDRNAEMLYDGSKFLIKTPSGDRLSIADSSSNELLTVNPNNGNVGIGTTSPKGKLELNNGTSAVELQFKETSTAYNRLGIRKEGSLLQLGEFDNNGDTFTSILAVDGNGDKVGIGITNPARLLHLKNSNSSIAFETPIDANGSAYAQIKSGRDGSSGYSSTLEFATTESTTAVGTFGSNGTGGSGFVTRMLIDSAGNVGIGTTNPAAKLDLQTSGHPLYIRTGAGANDNLFVFENPTAGPQLRMYEKGTSNVAVKLSTHDDSYFNGGNVGIGTTNPNFKTSILAGPKDTSPIALALSLDDSSMGVDQEVSLGYGQTDLVFSKISSYYEGASGFGLKIYTGTRTGATGIDRTKVDPSLTIDSNGNVGIGTTNPRSRLDIIGKQPYQQSASDLVTSVSKSALAVQGASDAGAGLFVGVETSDAKVYLQGSNGNGSAAVDLLLQPFGGDVGIGTANPGSKLEVYSNSTSNLYPMVHNDSVGNAGWRLKNNHGDWVMIANAALRFYDVGQSLERMRIDSDGNVGIGTTNPTSVLHLEGDLPTLKIRSTDAWSATTGPVISFQGKNNNGNTKHFAGIKAYSAGAELGELAFNIRKSNDDPEHEAMRIAPNGNVGIGTSSPLSFTGFMGASAISTTINSTNGAVLNLQRGVDINNSSVGALQFVNANNSSSTGMGSGSQLLGLISVQNSTSDSNAGSDAGGNMRLYTKQEAGSCEERMRIDSAGNVGIGTTNPDSKLHVSGDYIQVDNGYGLTTVGGLKYIADLDNNAPSSGALHRFFTDNGTTTALTILKSGNVGIGTTNPGSYKLNVNGTARVASGDVTSDDRVKHNEQEIVGALETLSKITPKKYIKTIEMYDANHDFELDADGNPVDENGEPVEHHIEAGVIAQQVLTVDELAFAVSPEGVDEDGTVISPHGLDYNSLFTYAIAAIQEQQSIINDLKSRIEQLEK